MKRLISVILLILAALTMVQQASARSVNPKADSLAIAQMRERMAEIRKNRPAVALVLKILTESSFYPSAQTFQ